MLKRHRLVNVDGIGALVIDGLTVPLDSISDELAEVLAGRGSRYVEALPEAEPPAPEPADPEAPAPRRSRQKPA